MAPKTYIECLECDAEIEGELEYGEFEGDDDYVFPDACPDCGSELGGGADCDKREDFHSDG